MFKEEIIKSSLIMTIAFILDVQCIRGPHHPKNHEHYVPKRGGPKLTQDIRLLRDIKHIEEDLKELSSKITLNETKPEEIEFQYFQLHDFDNNTKLDGLELLQALKHSVHFDYHEDNKDLAKFNDNDNNIDFFVELIDKVLEEDDLNMDGYLSYIEYVKGRMSFA